VALVRVQLRAGGIADHPQAVRDPEPPVAGQRGSLARVEPVVFEPEILEGKGASDRQEDRVALRRGSVVQVDHVGAIRARSRSRRDSPDAEPDVDAVASQELGHHGRVARMLGGHQPIA
jgi:hypothetical protein